MKLLLILTLTIQVVSCDKKRKLRLPDAVAHKSFHNKYLPEHFAAKINNEEYKGRQRVNQNAPIDFSKESIAMAFSKGASLVEVDLVTTKDGRLLLFPSKKLDFTTNLTGLVADYTLNDLKEKMAPNHQIYWENHKVELAGRPFFNKGIGGILDMQRVLELFPNHQFILDPKSYTDKTTKAFANIFKRAGAGRLKMWGSKRIYQEVQAQVSFPIEFIHNHYLSRACLDKYLKSSRPLPPECQKTSIIVDVEYSRKLKNWPDDFINQMHQNKSKVYYFNYDWNLGEKGDSELNAVLKSPVDGIITGDLNEYSSFLKDRFR